MVDLRRLAYFEGFKFREIDARKRIYLSFSKFTSLEKSRKIYIAYVHIISFLTSIGEWERSHKSATTNASRSIYGASGCFVILNVC